jgi:hypothetical protein
MPDPAAPVCFTVGTPVMIAGGLAPIEQIKLGSRVITDGSELVAGCVVAGE